MFKTKNAESTETTAPKAKKDYTTEKQLAKYIAKRVALGLAIHFATEALIKAIDNKAKKNNETIES